MRYFLSLCASLKSAYRVGRLVILKNARAILQYMLQKRENCYTLTAYIVYFPNIYFILQRLVEKNGALC